MKFFLRLFLIIILISLVSHYAPWWILVVVCFVVGCVVPGSGISGFLSGFIGTAIVWMAYAWSIDNANDSAFSTQILDILPLGQPLQLIAVTGLVGGICGGFATLSGVVLRSQKKLKKTHSYIK